jgi:glycosyltransferase involved in cell wall biosynthesis
MIEPLVTIGVPTYNRAAGLARALEAMCAQTYRNLEIIVSDNASTDPNVEKVVRDVMARDARVIYHRHPQNIGAMANFSSLVSKGNGDFFMWAADDDRWEAFFVERCVRELVADPDLAVCQMEAQFEISQDSLFPFFFEGAAFHRLLPQSPPERVKHLLRNVYGNLVYGIFRRKALLHKGRPITEWIGPTLNEIPMQILFASRGSIRVLPEIGMYKSAPLSVCEEARWERVGGELPNWTGWWAHVNASRSLHRYHKMVVREVCVAIDDLGYDKRTTRRLRGWAAFYLLRHEIYLAVRWKPKSASSGHRRVISQTEKATSFFE